MTPQLQAAIAAIQKLSVSERQELLQLLNQSQAPGTVQPDLSKLSTQFWQGTSLPQILATQTPTIVHNLEDLAADFWPAEDSIEEFLAFLQEQKQEAL